MILKNITKKITRIFFSFLFVFLLFLCLGFTDTNSVLAVCPDGSIDGFEQCDPPDFGVDDCDSVIGGTDGGNLGCTGACTFDTSCCIANACKKDPTVTITPNAPSNKIGDVETYTITVFNNDDNVCGVCLPRNFNLVMNINPSGTVDANGDPALIYETAFGSNPLNVAAQNSNSTTFDVKSDEGWGLGNYTFEVTVSEGSNSVTESEIYNIGAIDVEICGLTDTDGDGIVDTSVDDDGDTFFDCDDTDCLGAPECCGNGNIEVGAGELCDSDAQCAGLDPNLPICSNNCQGGCVATPASCSIGWGNCDSNPTTGVNGCETDLFIDASNCGSCDNVCKAGNCLSGKCPSLPVGGIVPCGRLKDNPATSWMELQPCNICHFVIFASEIINFLMGLVVLITILAIVVAGIIHVKAGGDSGLILAAKQNMNKILYGFVIVFSVWVIVNLGMVLFGFNDPLGDGRWEKLSCDLGTFVYCGDGMVQDPNDLGEVEECEASETLVDYTARKTALAVGCVDGDGNCPDGCFSDVGVPTDDDCDSALGTWAVDVSRCNSSCKIACKDDPLEDKIGQGCFIGACQKGRYACDMEGGGVGCLDIYGDPKYALSPWYLNGSLYDYCCNNDHTIFSDGFVGPAGITPFVVRRGGPYMAAHGLSSFHCEDVCADDDKVCVGVGLSTVLTYGSVCKYVIHDNGSNCNLPGNNAATNCKATFSIRNGCDCTAAGVCFGVRETACYCAF